MHPKRAARAEGLTGSIHLVMKSTVNMTALKIKVSKEIKKKGKVKNQKSSCFKNQVGVLNVHFREKHLKMPLRVNLSATF